MTERKVFTEVNSQGEIVKVSKTQIYKRMLEESVIQENELYKGLVEHEIDLLSRKAKSRTSTPNAEDVELGEKILEVLGSDKMRSTEIFGVLTSKGVNISSPQKVTSLLGKLIEKNLVQKSMDKRVTYFSKVEG